VKTLVGKHFDCVETNGEAIAGLAFSPDGETLAACFGTTVLVVTVEGCALVRRFDTAQPVNGLAFSPDGARLAAACDDAVRVFEVSSGATSELRAELAGFDTAAWSPDGRTIAAGYFEPLVVVFDAAAGALMQTLNPDIFDDEGRTCVLFAPDGRRLASTAYNSVILWSLPEAADTGGRKVPRKKLSVSGHAHIIDAAFSPDGRRLAGLADTEGASALHVWEVETAKKIGRVKLPHSSTRLAWLGGGALVAVAEDGGDGVSLWDAGTQSAAEDIRLEGIAGESVGAIAARPTGALIAAGTEDGRVVGWEIGRANR
jgi:WD40 repeat protein